MDEYNNNDGALATEVASAPAARSLPLRCDRAYVGNLAEGREACWLQIIWQGGLHDYFTSQSNISLAGQLHSFFLGVPGGYDVILSLIHGLAPFLVPNTLHKEGRD